MPSKTRATRKPKPERIGYATKRLIRRFRRRGDPKMRRGLVTPRTTDRSLAAIQAYTTCPDVDVRQRRLPRFAWALKALRPNPSLTAWLDGPDAQDDRISSARRRELTRGYFDHPPTAFAGGSVATRDGEMMIAGRHGAPVRLHIVPGRTPRHRMATRAGSERVVSARDRHDVSRIAVSITSATNSGYKARGVSRALTVHGPSLSIGAPGATPDLVVRGLPVGPFTIRVWTVGWSKRMHVRIAIERDGV